MTSSTFLTIWIAMFAVIVVMTIVLALIIKIKWGRTPAVTVITTLVLTGGLVAVGRRLFKQNMVNSCFFTILTILIAIIAINVGIFIFGGVLFIREETPSTTTRELLPAFLAIDMSFALMVVLVAGFIAVGMLFLGQNITNPVWLVLIATFETILIVGEHWLINTPYWD